MVLVWPPTQWAVFETDTVPHVLPVFEGPRGLQPQEGHRTDASCPCRPEYRMGDPDHRDLIIHRDYTHSSEA